MKTSASQTQKERVKAIVSRYKKHKTPLKLKTSDGAYKMPEATRRSPGLNRNKLAKRQPSATQQKTIFVRSDGDEIEPSSLGICLMSDLIAVFEEKKATKMRTKRLLVALCKYKRKPWATYSRRGHKIGARQLSDLLREFEIHSKDIRFRHGVAKGYLKAWFIEAMSQIKYLYATTQQPR